jgi:hypothetical protein
VPSKGKKDTKRPAKKTGAIVSKNVGNYETHPFFVKKANKAKAYRKAAGLPKQLVSKP